MSIIATLNDLDNKMSNLNVNDNNGLFAKWRNGRAARSAKNLTNLVQRRSFIKSSDEEKVLKKIKNLESRFRSMSSEGGFVRRFFGFCWKSNTEAQIEKALSALNELVKRTKERCNRTEDRLPRESVIYWGYRPSSITSAQRRAAKQARDDNEYGNQGISFSTGHLKSAREEAMEQGYH